MWRRKCKITFPSYVTWSIEAPMACFAPRCAGGVVAAVLAASMLHAHPAIGNEAEERKAEAKRLFEQGSAAMAKGNATKGCALIRQSLELFVVANSLFNAALCDEREGKLRSALTHWKRGLSLVDQRDPRAAVATRNIGAIEKRLPRVKITVPAKIAPVIVDIDGEEIAASELDSLVPVDPGKHIVTIRKAGYQDKHLEIALDESLRTEVIAELGLAIFSAPNAEVPKAASGQGPNLRTAAFVTLGVGVLGAIGAGVTGGMIASNDAVIDAECVQGSCDHATFGLVEQQRTLLPVNAAMWGVGAIGVSTAVILFVIGSKTDKQKASEVLLLPLPTVGGAGIGLSGRF